MENASVGRDGAEDTTAVMDSLRAVVRALRISTRAVEKEIGISGAQLFVLQQLMESPARSVNDLAERTSTHQSSVSTVVSRLVERGFARREPSADDGRRMEISITERGRALVEAAPLTAQMRMQQAMRRMSADQARVLGEALETLVREAGFAGEPVSMFFEDYGGPES
ncbi:MAG TPA: MarR family transcriptional regulator [Longimicrobium sp.]|nr:MarR family transcriptional regulator [Longimicrobium sp.]